MGSTLTFSYQAIGDELLRAGWMQAEMLARAEEVMAYAVAIAPVYTGRGWDPHRGRYRDSFYTSSGIGGYKHDRAAGYVHNDSPEALVVEFGNRNQRPHATLRTALNAAG